MNLPDGTVNYLENDRTNGASGSWNTGLDFLHHDVEAPENLFVAILDDDDSWAPGYLERCIGLACGQRLDMVAAGINRFETADAAPLSTEPPDALRAADFLAGNPGIQGSNLFVRLSVLLAAGGFDEALQSSTDRDLCIRISDLGTVRYGRLTAPLVQHFADAGRERLSTRGSAAKLQGLTSFWQKYASRMSARQKRAFCERARRLFDWRPNLVSSKYAIHGRHNDESHLTARLPNKTGYAPAREPFDLYVGVISGDPAMLRPLLLDLVALRSLPSIADLIVVILENGGPRNEFRTVVEELRHDGLKIAFVSEDQQRADAADGSFSSQYSSRPPGRVGIAQARTMLQRYLGALLQTDEGSFGWILDDDMRVDEGARAYLPWLPAFRERGVDAVIGQYEGSSPNPPLNGVRVQLVDLFHNLFWLQSLDPSAPLPDRSSENQVLRDRYPDYYYDLSRKHSGHLEMPHWLEPAFEGETVGEGYARLRAGALGILSGAPVTRPLMPHIPHDPIAKAKDSVNRGGCTFVLNHRPLTQTPNTIMRVGGQEARRSDMVWAIVNRYYRGMSIKKVGFPILHRGRVTPTPSLNLEKVTGEIVGSAFYAGLTEFLGDNPHHELNFSSDERKRVCELVKTHLSRRLRAMKLNFCRIRGLAAALERVTEPEQLEELIAFLHRWFTPQVFAAIRDGARALPQHDFDTFLSSLQHTADDYAEASVRIDFIQDQLRSESRQFTPGYL